MKTQDLKVAKMALFYTPKNVEEIQNWIEAHPKDERAHLYTAMGMTWNFLAELIERHNELNNKSV